MGIKQSAMLSNIVRFWFFSLIYFYRAIFWKQETSTRWGTRSSDQKNALLWLRNYMEQFDLVKQLWQRERLGAGWRQHRVFFWFRARSCKQFDPLNCWKLLAGNPTVCVSVSRVRIWKPIRHNREQFFSWKGRKKRMCTYLVAETYCICIAHAAARRMQSILWHHLVWCDLFVSLRSRSTDAFALTAVSKTQYPAPFPLETEILQTRGPKNGDK